MVQVIPISRVNDGRVTPKIFGYCKNTIFWNWLVRLPRQSHDEVKILRFSLCRLYPRMVVNSGQKLIQILISAPWKNFLFPSTNLFWAMHILSLIPSLFVRVCTTLSFSNKAENPMISKVWTFETYKHSQHQMSFHCVWFQLFFWEMVIIEFIDRP